MTKDDLYLEGNTKFCVTCGSKIHEKAEICPYCGVRCVDMENNKTKNTNRLHNSTTLAIIGIILGITSSFIGYSLIGFMYAFTGSSLNLPLTFLGFGFLTSILVVLGIILEKYDMKIASAQYIVCGLFLLITGYFIIGLIPAICLFVAGIFAFQNRVKDETMGAI